MHWSKVPIIECGQPLERVAGSGISVQAAYYQKNLKGSRQEVWLRKEVIERLRQAAQLLPPGRGLVVWDGWRSYQLQETLHRDVTRAIAAQQGLSGRQLEQAVNRFVATPSRNPKCPSPHLTGGAVDLCLSDQHGNPLNMEGEFDELSDRSRTNYYENKPDYAEIRDRRRLLCAVMTHVGFSNYPEEWWHFDLGNQFHHQRVGGPARFGLVDAPPR